jgi:hypothetical protein
VLKFWVDEGYEMTLRAYFRSWVDEKQEGNFTFFEIRFILVLKTLHGSRMLYKIIQMRQKASHRRTEIPCLVSYGRIKILILGPKASNRNIITSGQETKSEAV